MNLLATYNYQLADHKRPIAIYYIVIVCLTILMTVTTVMMISGDTDPDGNTGTFSGYEFITIIFLFVIGLCTFKENFLMSVQNGISRKTLFTGKLLTMATVAAFMAIVDKIIFLIMSMLTATAEGVQVSTLYEVTFFGRISEFGPVSSQLLSMLFEFTIALAVMALGYFITIMFYRLNRMGKVLVGAGVPILWMIILPILDSTLFHGAISAAGEKFWAFVFGSPSHVIGSAFVGFAVFSALSYALMRRAVVKE